MTSLVKVISADFDDAKKRIVKFLRFGKSDTQTAIEASPYGVDSCPIKDSVGVYAETAEKGKVVLIGYLVKNKKAKPGEYRVFATNSDGEEKFYIWMKADGTMEQGGNTNFAVKYNELKAELDKLKTTLNNLVTSYNSHTHPYVNVTSGSNTSTITSPAQSNSSDFSQAKNDKIKTIG